MVSRLRRWAASLLPGVAPRLSLFIAYGFCEVRGCWEPASTMLIDLKEGEPTEDNFRTWSKLGPNHYFCEEHDRPSLDYHLNGTVVVTAHEVRYGGRDD